MISYTEDSATYHASTAIGSGDIRRMIRSARLYKDGMEGILERETKALLFGVAAHLRLLEPEAFDRSVAHKPDGMSFATKEGKAWRDAQVGKLIVTHDDGLNLTRMHERMPDEVRAVFNRCKKEVTVRNEFDGLAVQCRPDLWDVKAGWFYDLKTIDGIEKIDRTIWTLSYHIQLAWYRRVILAETDIKNRATLIFAEKNPPYRWRMIALDSDYQALAEEAIDEALAQIRARMRSGCWEDDGALTDIASPPEWAANSLAADFDDDADELEAEAV